MLQFLCSAAQLQCQAEWAPLPADSSGSVLFAFPAAGAPGPLAGPSEWHRSFPIAEGDRQSPIDIVPSQATYNPNLTPLVVSYELSASHTISNNGHSVMVDFEDCDDKTVISGGPLEGPYRLKQFHFHWGTKTNQGSEHTVNGKSFPCETGHEHTGMNRLTDALYMVKFKGTKAQFDNFNPKCLLPSKQDYWTYPGSLTTPPLNESVLWIMLKDPVYVSEKQMLKFRKTLFCNCEEEDGRIRMVNNFRPPQPLKGRTVQASFKS
uniref:Carbonic anhydrase 7 isoform X3 n=1 Tax=Geotrypetes seraphini TaxID=260995 RepID=A0A6P8RDK1_GEOSA|nr:carbonic anhydrase 7 isoform X3 [Geotrypetes seraphini]